MGGPLPDGQTPIDEDEAAELLLSIRTQEALNRAEQANIVNALVWAQRSRIVRTRLLTDAALKRIHKEMFGGVWRWAGKYRLSDKNFGCHWPQIAEAVRQLCGNFDHRVNLGTEDADELAIEFHHRLVSIHPFPNGNGRHSRFCADRLIENLGGPAFAWGRADLQTSGRSRDHYLQALRAADSGDFAPLVAFARTEE